MPTQSYSLITKRQFVYIFSICRKKKLLSPDELELPWRPLYKALRFLIEPDENYLDMYSISPIYETAIESLILCSKAYFPVSKYLPRIN